MSATTVDPTPQTDPQPTTPATSPDPTTAQQQGNAERTFTQADLDRIVNERLERERRRAEEAQERVRREAEEARLAEQNEFRTLAEQRAERIVELEAQSAQVETLTQERDAALSVVRELVSGELEAAPDYVRDAIAERDPVAQLRYLNQHRDKWSSGTTPPRGTPPATRATGNANLTLEERIAQEERALRASGRYSI
jgi:hypothetical protein